MSLYAKELIRRLEEAGFINADNAYTHVKWRGLDGLTLSEAVLYGVDSEKIDKVLDAYEEGYYI